LTNFFVMINHLMSFHIVPFILLFEVFFMICLLPLEGIVKAKLCNETYNSFVSTLYVRIHPKLKPLWKRARNPLIWYQNLRTIFQNCKSYCLMRRRSCMKSQRVPKVDFYHFYYFISNIVLSIDKNIMLFNHNFFMNSLGGFHNFSPCFTLLFSQATNDMDKRPFSMSISFYKGYNLSS